MLISLPLPLLGRATAMAVPMMMLQLILLTERIECIDRGDYQHLHTDSFQKNDEYNLLALDPATPYGSPYGGFSRNTASRLAALPLKLPSISKEVSGSVDDTTFEPMYTTVRDNFGREFSCRVYHEDELEPDSLDDSMFDTPRLKKNKPPSANEHGTEQPKKDTEEAIPRDPSQDGISATEPKKSKDNGIDAQSATTTASSMSMKLSNPEQSKDNGVGAEAATTAASSMPMKLSEMGFDPIMIGHTIHQRLTKLTGLCAQYHPATWWSYEWCHQENIRQFHVKVSRNSNGKIQKVDLEHVTNLGSFSGRKIHVGTTGETSSQNDHRMYLTQGRKEIGTVVDTFIGGGACPETGKPRVTEVAFRCCSKTNIRKGKGGVLKNGNQLDTDIVTLFQASEDKDLVCRYNITLCTPLLCEDYEDEDENGKSAPKSMDTNSDVLSASDSKSEKSAGGRTNRNKHVNLDLDPAEAEKMSVVEILERTFGTVGNFCIRSQTADWWAYEFCPGEHVRQYHEEETNMLERVFGISTTEKKKTTSGATEHFLGRYTPDDHKGVTKENEWEYIVNSTTSAGSKYNFPLTNENGKKSPKSQGGPSKNAGGNGAYFFQEYTKGDICDHEDVTDSAIKAGEFGEGGIERAITVRYSCNSDLTISVKEDSTCHYILDITVPTLCHHPVFKAPVSKRQVVKCLPTSN